MVQGQAVPEVVQWIIVRLSVTMPVEDIAMYTDVGQRTVKKIISHFRRTGDISTRKPKPPTLHRTLCDFDIEVYCSLILFHVFLMLKQTASSCFRLSTGHPTYTLRNYNTSY
jgi:hypothetical protein